MSSRLPTVILASASPRRRELLTLVGIHFKVIVSNVDETIHPRESPMVYAERIARAKADAIPGKSDSTVIIAADTIVVIDDMVLGKPSNDEEAARMLRQLSGRTHKVYTAVAVRRGEKIVSVVEDVDVTFRSIDDDEIASYIRTGEPMDKAGSYGIQGYGATIVQRIDGDYFAVMGLSLVRLVELLNEVGVSYQFGPLYLKE